MENNELLTIEQAAELLHVSKRTIQNYVTRRQLKARRRVGGRRLYFAKTDLLQMVELW